MEILPPDPEHFGPKPHDVRYVLVRRGISSRRLAQWVNAELPEHRQRDESTVGLYLRRQSIPQGDWLQACSKVLGLPVGELFDFSPEPTER